MIVKDLIAKLQSMEVLVSWDGQQAGDVNEIIVKKLEDMYGDYDGFPDEWIEINGSQ